MLLSAVFSYAQTPGDPANFSIRGDFYSGTFSTLTDDWFKGLTANGMINESNSVANLAITNSKSNTPFVERQSYPQFSVVGGYLLYDAIYARDYINMLSSSNNDKSTFDGGDKNGDNPITWKSIPSNVGASVDLVDSYAHIRRGGTKVTDNLWLDMAVTSLDSSGDHFVDFELFTEPLEVDLSTGEFSNVGPDEGHTAWKFDPPVGGKSRIADTGDLVAGFSFNGSNVSNVELRIWVSRYDFENVTPFKFEWGSSFDGATTGSLYGYAQIVIPAPKGKYNTGSLINRTAPPWKTFIKGSGVPEISSVYLPGSFAEVGIDLSALGIDPSLKSGNACESPFTRILIKSRSSSSFTSQLKDFAGPYEFLGVPVVPTDITATPSYFTCEINEITLTPTFAYAGNHYYNWTTSNGEFKDGSQSVSGEFAIITKPGTYRLTAAPVQGCTETWSEITIYAEPCAVIDNMGEVVENTVSLPYNVLANDTDADSGIHTVSLLDPTSITQVSPPSNGSISINTSTGEITYTPNVDFYGTDSFTYQVCDTPIVSGGAVLCDTATVTVTVLEDVDNDGVGNIYDLDNDNDGIPDSVELQCTLKTNVNLLINGDFEDVNIITDSPKLDEDSFYDKTTLPTPGIWRGLEMYISGWKTNDTSNHIEIWQNPDGVSGYINPDTYGAFSGIQFAEVEAVSVDGPYQDVATTPGDILRWTFAHRNRYVSTDDKIAIVMGDPNGTLTLQGTFTSAANYAWTEHTGTYTVPAGQTTTRLWLTGLASYGGVGSNFIDKVNLEIISNLCVDADADGIPNYLDLDSDNDGIPDVLEAGLTDANNDGLVDTSSYGVNGLADNVETFADSGILNYVVPNTDATSDNNPNFILYNFLDVDSDNDGLTDTTEAFSNNTLYNDTENNGIIDGFVDTDNNGWHDTIDAETTFPTPLNSDADAFPNHLDLDSDGDGLPDTFEANFQVLDGENNGIVGTGIPDDTDGDGLADTNDPDFTGNILTGYGFNKDRDFDGVKNYLDIDIDNDGIIDNIEGQPTFSYRPPTGLDTDGDGIDNAYDVNIDPTYGIGYTNTDGGSAPDYADTDSENDSAFDILENATANGIDAVLDVLDNETGVAGGDGMVDQDKFVDVDGDGLHDAFDLLIASNSNSLNATNNNQVPTDHPDTDPIGGDRDWREAWEQDYDNDGIPDVADLDDDNDGILDSTEDLNIDGDNDPRTNPTDTDLDGIPNYFDLDSDGDGIPDTLEAGGIYDADGSGMPGTGILTAAQVGMQVNVDYGVPNQYTIVGGYTQIGLVPVDTDLDGIPDYLDSDSDNDGITDVIEVGGVDANGDGIYGPGATNDSDADGLADAIDPYDNSDLSALGTPLTILVDGYHQAIDTDSDSHPNYLDLDSDNDTIPDNVESQSTLGYVAPSGVDNDNSGIDNSYDVHIGINIIPIDTDADGTPDYLDLDSDNDGLFDIVEAHDIDPLNPTTPHTSGETNNIVGANGLDNSFDDASAGDTFLDSNGNLDNSQEDNFIDADQDVLYGGDVDYRDITFNDNDNDTIPDAVDLDDDNDGILDTVESNGVDPLFDTDKDGIPDYLDEDYCASKSSSINAFGVCSYFDTDNDGIPNLFDLDSDADGCWDVLEAYEGSIEFPNVDTNGDGVYGSSLPTPVNANGTVSAASYSNPNQMNSGVYDFLDLSIGIGCKADLSLIKLVYNDLGNPITEITIGATIIYTITISNVGPYSTTNIKVKDNIAEGLINITGSSDVGTFDSKTGIWDLQNYELLVGGDETIIITATVGPNCGPLSNTAEIISSERQDPDSIPANGN